MEKPVAPASHPTGVAFTLIRGGMKILSRTAPSLASRVAEDLFMTPRRYRAPERELAALGAAMPFSLPFGDGEIQGWRWGSGKPIILAHGWEGRGSQMTPFVSALIENGHSIATFDAPGHGRSSGKRSSLPAFSQSLAAVAAHCGGAAGVIAHSFGCAATALAMHDGLDVPRVVFIAPPLDPADYTERFGQILGLTDGVVERMRQRIQRRFSRSWSEYSLGRLAMTLTAPLLVIHDRDDNETFLHEGEEIVRRWQGSRLIITEGLGHRRILRDERVISEVAEFFS